VRAIAMARGRRRIWFMASCPCHIDRQRSVRMTHIACHSYIAAMPWRKKVKKLETVLFPFTRQSDPPTAGCADKDKGSARYINNH
jgi:hypothetical protein